MPLCFIRIPITVLLAHSTGPDLPTLGLITRAIHPMLLILSDTSDLFQTGLPTGKVLVDSGQEPIAIDLLDCGWWWERLPRDLG
jgi:hypothetical protein